MEQQSTGMPGADRDDESGKYRSKYPTEDFLDAIADAGGTAGTQDVADAVACSYETAYKKLRALEDSGVVESTKFGNARAWSVVDESAAQPPRERSASQDGRDTTPDDERREADARAESDAENTAAMIVDSCSYKRDLTSPRRRHLEAWIQHTADADGGVQLSDFKSWWTDERASETGYNAGSFWEAFAKATMKQSDQFTKPNARTYRYIGETET